MVRFYEELLHLAMARVDQDEVPNGEPLDRYLDGIQESYARDINNMEDEINKVVSRLSDRLEDGYSLGGREGAQLVMDHIADLLDGAFDEVVAHWGPEGQKEASHAA